ncbi:putative bifunctional diguanylate cyclase/phosphodiesterase [Actinomycetes bacterium M1A6_2h]
MISGWSLVVIFNVITASAYLGIVIFIVRGLQRGRQLRHNKLAVATAVIFFTCAAHHVLHALHLVEATDGHGGSGNDMGTMNTMRESMGGGIDIAVTAATAVAGVAYLGLRRSYGSLLGSPSMFDDAAEARYRQLAQNLPHTAVLLTDKDLRFVLVEGADLEAEGYDPRLMEGRLLRDVLPPQTLALFEPHYRAAVAGHESTFDLVSERTGRVFRLQARPLRDESERIVGAMVLSEDVTAERQAEAELERAQAFRDAVLTVSPDVTVITDVRSGKATWTSRSLGSLLGGPPTAAVDVVPEDEPTVDAANADTASMQDGESLTIRYRVTGSDGTLRWLSRRSTPFRRSTTGEVVEVLSLVREVTDVVEAERALERAALEDSLTGLPNRMLLLDRISSAIARGERTGVLPTILFCDLDGFKRVNDTGGHAAGDAVLVEVARRLRSALRAGDSIARVGGDEFVVVAEALPPEHGEAGIAERLAERIQSVLTPPIEHQGARYVVSASIGMVLVRPGGTAQEALRDADSAMYRAKQLGKNRIERFDDLLRADVLDRARIEQALRDALDPTGIGPPSLRVAFQPIHSLDSGRLAGFEALARLRDASGTEIAPDQFIPVAEDTGLIDALGLRILDSALAMLVEWRARHPAATSVTMAVNMSTRQAQHSDMSTKVRKALERSGLTPHDLILELTESVLLESGSSTLRQLRELRASGVGIAIDDFGTGYASLRYLATLPVTAVKIDRSFTATMTTDPTNKSIVHAIITLTRDLEVACVVEGIETVDQLDALPGSVQGQGFLFGRPTEGLVGS